MLLQPKRPPGRIDRKAGAFASEIVELRRAGYTYDAIREALADVGIELSTTTLRREVRRLRSAVKPTVPRTAAIPPVTAIVAQPQAPPPISPTRHPGPKGRDVAEAFFEANPSNHLLRTQERS